MENKLYTGYTPGEMPLAEYPRPQLRRADYTILNGAWEYAITDSDAFLCRARAGM